MRRPCWTVVIAALAIGGYCGHEPALAAPVESLEQFASEVRDVPLGEKTSRFDYMSLDSSTGRLFVAGMGRGKLLVFDTRQFALLTELDGFAKVTGVLAVPALHKVYASVPGAGIGASVSVALGIAGLSSGSGGIAIVDSESLREIARLRGGVFPDGIAYDPDDGKLYVSDELGGGLDVVGTRTDAIIGRIDAGGEVGNVQYDPATKLVYAPVQSKNALAVIDPKTDRLLERVQVPEAKHPHGLHIAPGGLVAYLACDGNDVLLVINLKNRRVIHSLPLGHDPDVLADDQVLKRLYVAGESGVLSVFDISSPDNPREIARVAAGANAHSIAVDPESHRLYLPLRDVGGKAVMRVITPRLQ